MDHQKVYDAIIAKARLENRVEKSLKQRKKENITECYYDNHHIFPKCLGGSDEKENMQLLTAKEHYVCHKLLTYIYPNVRGLVCALIIMTFSKKFNRCIKSARDYDYVRNLLKNIPVSEETRQRQSKNNVMNNSSVYEIWIEKFGKEIADEKEKNKNKKLSDSLKGHTVKEEDILKIIKTRKERNCNLGEKNGMFGKSVYQLWVEKFGIEEANRRRDIRSQKMSNSRTGEKNPMFGVSLFGEKNGMFGKHHKKESIEKIKNIPKITCEYCSRSFRPCAYNRWHGEKCKLKNNFN
jgi:hypothetical protein